MATVSERKLNQLLKKRAQLEARLKRQDEQRKKLLAQGREEQQQIEAVIEEERFRILIKTLRETKFPVDQTALLIGLALEAAAILDGPDSEEKRDRINGLTARYAAFTKDGSEATRPLQDTAAPYVAAEYH